MTALSKGEPMQREFSLEYWTDDGWFAGRLREAPGVFSQGETLEALEENIRDSFRMMQEDAEQSPAPGAQVKELAIDV